MNKILWNSIKSPLRYFWVPAGEDVFAGEYQIENGDGEEAAVNLESPSHLKSMGNKPKKSCLVNWKI